jgi:hypothetical protein
MMQKYPAYIIGIFTVLSVFAMGMLVPPQSCSEELKTEPAIVTLTGTLSKASFENDAYKRREQVYVLNLVTPIDVAGDELGDPVKNVKKIQVIFMRDSVNPENFLNKKLRITGSLFHAHTAHHFTDVLIQIKEMAFNQQK